MTPAAGAVRTSRPAIPATAVGLLVAVGAFLVFWMANQGFDAGRGDFFYLADAFLHGRTWIESPLGPNDVILIDGRTYVPFAPFPAIVLAPLVALVGPVTADQLESGVNAFLAATVVFLAWWAAGRIGVERLRDRFGARAAPGAGHAGPVGHHPRRRLAHRAPRGDDPDAAADRRDVRASGGPC